MMSLGLIFFHDLFHQDLPHDSCRLFSILENIGARHFKMKLKDFKIVFISDAPVNNDATKLFATNIAATAGVAPSTSTASAGGLTNSVYPNIQQQEPIRGFVMQQQLHPSKCN